MESEKGKGTYAGIDAANLVLAACAAVVAAALAVDDAGCGAGGAPLKLRGFEADGLEGGVDGQTSDELGREENEDGLEMHLVGYLVVQKVWCCSLWSCLRRFTV